MTDNVTTAVSGDVEAHTSVHLALVERSGADVSGPLVHLGRSIADGDQVIEVWESKDHCHDCDHDSQGVIPSGPGSSEANSGSPGSRNSTSVAWSSPRPTLPVR